MYIIRRDTYTYTLIEARAVRGVYIRWGLFYRRLSACWGRRFTFLAASLPAASTGFGLLLAFTAVREGRSRALGTLVPRTGAVAANGKRNNNPKHYTPKRLCSKQQGDKRGCSRLWFTVSVIPVSLSRISRAAVPEGACCYGAPAVAAAAAAAAAVSH